MGSNNNIIPLGTTDTKRVCTHLQDHIYGPSQDAVKQEKHVTNWFGAYFHKCQISGTSNGPDSY